MNLPAGFPTEAVDIVIGGDSPEDTGEHILIEDEFDTEALEPRTLCRRSIIHNRLGGTRTEILFYDEGFVRLRGGTRKRVLTDHICELHFLDPACDTHRQIASRWLWGALAIAAVALSCWALMPLVGLAAAMPYTIAILLAASAAVLRIGLLRSVEEQVFSTATGRAVVLKLTANLGCFRKVRAAARDISAAIRGVCIDTGTQDVRRLRAEMRAHYRLLERGVISKEACSDGTRQILAHFG